MKNKLFITSILLLLVGAVFGQVDSVVVVPDAGSFSLYEKISTVFGVIATLVTTFFGFKLGKVSADAETGVAKAALKLNEALALASKAIAALKDGTLTPAEIDDLVKTYNALKG